MTGSPNSAPGVDGKAGFGGHEVCQLAAGEHHVRPAYRSPLTGSSHRRPSQGRWEDTDDVPSGVQGADLEVATLDAALDNAKNAIAADVGPVSDWSVEYDETINDWFVQGLLGGAPVGSTAVVTGPEPVAPQPPGPDRSPAPPDGGREDWVRFLSFTGGTPAEVFGQATTWLAGRPDVVAVGDVAWSVEPGGYRLRVYYCGNDGAGRPGHR
ncbi:hypothetical protein [Krasilnikovia sp. M28-CT-15]|uniref:hypothetical protein n=1 Tax=Krasilnikovia sp. M28-CT-15 TaxID=3373540 RepID=UPI0038771AEF